MTKAEMIDAVAKGPGITKKAAGASCSACSAAALEALIGLITTALKKGLNVVLTGLGAFRVSERAARTGVDPRPKAKIKIPALKVSDV